MRISHSSYKKYIESIREEIENEKLFSPLLLNNKTIVFPLMEKPRQVFVISLNPKCPLAFKYQNDLFFSSFENSFIAKFRKHYGKTMIKNISLFKNDLVIKMDCYSIDEYVDFKMIIELIPNHPNLLIVDENGKLIDYYFSSKERSLKIGEPYVALENSDFVEGEIEINDEFLASRTKEEYEIREKEKYAPFTKYLNSKIKGAKRKIKAIENDVEIASKNLIYQEIADDIFSQGIDLKSHQNSVIFNNESISLDLSKTVLENAQQFYKKAKKAKETIERAKINIKNAENELNEFESIYNDFLDGNEKKKDELVSIYSNSKKKKEVKATVVNRPWKINLNGTIIYFGRNASQNDYLSFVMKLDREFTWMHIKDKSGAHLVIANKKPTENELLTASEIALLCSRVTTGEVSYTKKKNVRRGHVLGEALIKNYSNIKLNNIRKETITIFESAVRCD